MISYLASLSSAFQHQLVHPFHGEVVLGDEDDVGPRRLAALQGQPPCRPPHRLHHEDPPVGAGGSAQPVDFLHDHIHRRLKAQRVVGAPEVLVDRLGNTDQIHAFPGQPGGDAQGVLAADSHQRLQPQPADVLQDLLRLIVLGVIWIGPGGAQHGAAETVPGAYGILVQGHQPFLRIATRWVGPDQALPAIPDAHNFVLDAAFRLEAVIRGRLHHPLDGGVESGAVAAAGEYADPALFHRSG